MATRHSSEFWQAHLTAYQQTELTVTAYCVEHGLCAKTFYRWRSQLQAGSQPSPSLTLVPVSIQAPSAATTSVSSTAHLHSPAGWQIDLPLSNTPWLIDLLRQLP
jgi:transposase-like protein